MDFTVDGRFAELREHGHHVGRTLAGPSLRWRDHRAAWDPSLFTALGGEGVLGVALPSAHGGGAASPLETVALLEGLGAAGDVGLALSAGAHGVLCGVPIAALGTPEQHRRYLPPMVTGDRVAGVAPAELDGTDVRAVRSGRSWRLDGTRTGVVNAPVADHFLVTAVSDDGGRTAFLVDRDSAGVEVRADPDPSALRTRPVGDLVLTGCEVAAEAVLGTPGRATTELVPLLAALDRTCLLAPWLGLLRDLADRVTEAATALAWSQSVRLAVVDVRTGAELAADLLHRAAWDLGSSERASRRDPALAKLFLFEALATAARTALELGVPDRARAHRDSAALTAGDREVLRAVVAESLLALGPTRTG